LKAQLEGQGEKLEREKPTKALENDAQTRGIDINSKDLQLGGVLVSMSVINNE